ncbi:MAG: gliding motility protein GldL, partial [Bacteroidetes bacterium]|nr:gliding motility protein GldL [Candidatus Colenecus caballi]
PATVVTPVAATAESQLDTTGMEQVTQTYIDRIHELTAKMEQMCRHSEKMEQSSEEIEQLSRNLISINTFYQMHLKSASSQMENIEKVNAQTQLMVEKIEELNRVYARMVEAMKVNSQMGTK